MGCCAEGFHKSSVYCALQKGKSGSFLFHPFGRMHKQQSVTRYHRFIQMAISWTCRPAAAEI